MSVDVRITGVLSYEDDIELGSALEEALEETEAGDLLREFLDDGDLVSDGATLTFTVDTSVGTNDNVSLQDALEELAIAASGGSLDIWQDGVGAKLLAGGEEEGLAFED